MLQGSFGELRTVPDFDEAVTWMKKRFDYEGYAYPPRVMTSRFGGNLRRRPMIPSALPRDRRVSTRLPATHELRLPGASDDSDYSAKHGQRVS